MTNLHIGCGARIIPGWHNIDLDPPADTILDVRQGLPYTDGSVSLIYSEHHHEHLTLEEGNMLLSEYYRVLKPGGVLRISVPSLNKLLEMYINSNTTWASAVGWAPETPCQMVNQAMRLWGHQFLFDHTELYMCLERAGFSDVRGKLWGDTQVPDMVVEGRPDLGELIFEATK